jgi:peptide/nickel transport system permease protein
MSPVTQSASLWSLAWRNLRANTVAMISLIVVLFFILLSLASHFGLVAKNWNTEVGINYAPPTFAPKSGGPSMAERVTTNSSVGESAQSNETIGKEAAAPVVEQKSESTVIDPLADDLAEIKAQGKAEKAPEVVRLQTLPFGGDKWGRDILDKVIKGSETSILVGFAAAILATIIGTVLGAIAGYYGGWVDDVLNWFYSIFSAIPYLLLILAVAAVLQKKGVMTVILILGLTGWSSIFRLVRAEYMKHKNREYVQAASSIGASHARRMFIHIFPNISHVVLVQLSLHVVGFIKSEVILSYLGFGVPVDTVSWGSMINESQSELILGIWWQLAAATAFMAILVTAFSLLTDAMRDALDPKLK